jgi:nitrogen regulatory protein P-II 1
MKLIVAIIRPEKLAAVQTVLDEQDVYSLTVSEVPDCRREQSTTEIYRGREFRRPATQLRLEVAVDEGSYAAAIEAISRAAGPAFVMGLGEHAPARFGERGAALFTSCG